jgi:hypothetical protein
MVSPAKAVLFARPCGSVLKKNENKKRKICSSPDYTAVRILPLRLRKII